jgi:hypothetical protein
MTPHLSRRGRSTNRRRSLTFWTWACAGVLLSPPYATADATLEYQVKAAFLLNFTKFIEWPATAFADAGAPFTICVLGNDPFGSALEQVVSGETVGGRKLAVRKMDQPPAPQTCQVVFQAGTGKDRAAAPGSLGAGVLTVGEGESFVREGGIIAFVIDNHRVRFDINQSAADHAALKLSSKLLSVARSVTR